MTSTTVDTQVSEHIPPEPAAPHWIALDSPLRDWHTDLDVIYSAAVGTRDPQQSKISRTLDSTSGRTTAIHATIPDPRSPWMRSNLILFSLTYAENRTPGHFRIQSWAVRITGDDALTELALMIARFEPPATDVVLTPTLRPANRARPGAMTEPHAAHRVWQLAANWAASAALTGYPLTRNIPRLFLNHANNSTRLKAHGLINSERFSFSVSTSQEAHLRFLNQDGTVAREIGPLTLSEAGLSGSEPSDVQLSTLLTLLLTSGDSAQ